MFLPNPGIMAAGAGIVPPGQQLFTTSGTFIVPPGVTSICAVAIGAGHHAEWANWDIWYGGAGGGLAYSNVIPVTSGDALPVTVNASESRLNRGLTVLLHATRGSWDYDNSLMRGGAGLVGQVLRTGGWGGYRLANPASGGGAAGYTSDGEPGGGAGGSGYAGRGTSPYGGGAGGAAGAASSVAQATYGGGGGPSVDPGPGCLRIIWGEGRAFPNTNTRDL